MYVEKTTLSEANVNKLKGVFRQFDKDNSGSIDAGEVQACLKRFGLSLSDNQTNRLIRLIDANNSGRIEFEEFVKLTELALNQKKTKEHSLLPNSGPKTKPIFCFLYNKLSSNENSSAATEKYASHLKDSIGSVLKHVKDGVVGLIIPPDETQNDEEIQQEILTVFPNIDLSNVVLKHGALHFDNWNKGQHKLDLGLFVEDGDYDPIIWLNSTTRIFQNPQPLIDRFIRENKSFGFLPDHLAGNKRIQTEEPLFVPSSIFMVFSAGIAKPFFKLWEDIWREYITPYPFATLPNPAPFFRDSIYYVDQYALSKAFTKSVVSFDPAHTDNTDHSKNSDVYLIARSELHAGEIVLNKVTQSETQFGRSPWALKS